eukprot:2833600-Prorocentrum_lima.AAC.1
MGTAGRTASNATMAASVAQELAKLNVTIDPKVLLQAMQRSGQIGEASNNTPNDGIPEKRPRQG